MSTIFATCVVCLKQGELDPEYRAHQSCFKSAIENSAGHLEELDELKDELSDKTSIISELKVRMSGLESTVPMMRDEMNALRNEVQTLRSNAMYDDRIINHLKKEITALRLPKK